MKRSQRIRLVLLGTLSAGAFDACSPSASSTGAVSTGGVYTNDHYLPGVGYYHAPYRAWYPMPYNHYDAAQRLYYHGGQWAAEPHQSITNLSQPTPEAAQQAQATRTDTRRSGFGSTSRSHSTWS